VIGTRSHDQPEAFEVKRKAKRREPLEGHIVIPRQRPHNILSRNSRSHAFRNQNQMVNVQSKEKIAYFDQDIFEHRFQVTTWVSGDHIRISIHDSLALRIAPNP
jgi:UDP-N-acetylmuramyl pentapeptide synthase